MKLKTGLFLLIVLWITATMGEAQNSPQWNLPEGAIARLGNGTINEIAYSPDGSQIAVASSIGIWLYDVDTGIAVALLGGSNVTSIAYSPDGETIAGCGNFRVHRWGETIMSDAVRLWDIEKGTIIETLPYTTAGYLDVAYSPDGKTIAVSARYDPVRVWNIEEGLFQTTLPGEAENVSKILYSPDGSTIATLNRIKNSISLWDAEKGFHIKTLADENMIAFSDIAYSPDGSTIASTSWRDMYIWDVHTGTIEKKWSDLWSGFKAGAVHYSPDGAVIATTNTHSWVQLWDPEDPNSSNSSTIDTEYGIINFVYSPDGKTIATAGVDLTVRLWDVTGEFQGFRNIPKATLVKHTGPVLNVAYSPDGKTIATGTASYQDPSLHFWDSGTATLIKTVDHTRPVADIAYSPDGNTIATAGGFEGVRLWEANTGTFIKSLNEHGDSPEHQVENIAYSPDGSTLATSIANFVYLWQVSKSRVRETLTGPRLRISRITYSPDGNTVAALDNDLIVYFWSNDNGQLLHTFQGNDIRDIAYSPDGHTIATVSGNTEKPQLWDAETGTLTKTLDADGFVSSIVYSPDGATIATAGNFHFQVKLWDANTGTLKETFTGHAGLVNSLVYSPDGSVLATGNADGTVLLWGLTPSAISETRVKADVNNDGVVNIQDLVSVAASFGLTGQHPADVNGDRIVNIQDLVAVAAAFGEAAADAPAAGDLSSETVQQWLVDAQQLNFTDTISQRGIRFLEQLLLSLMPKKTALLANYPNPFNPETWIPYRLAKPAEVHIAIHAADGQLVRVLALGNQAAGMYQPRSRAAYWDGRNQIGEPVASGVYFYTLTAGDFNATRKMLIRK